MIISKFQKYSDIPNSNMFINEIPIFSTQNYADYLKEIKNHDTVWFTYIENNTVSYILPFSINKKLVFKKGYFLTGVISFISGNSLDKEKEFLEKVVIYIKKNKLCDWIQQGPNWAFFKTIPTGSKAVRFGTYKIFLKNKNEADLLRMINRYCRKDINYAKRCKVEIKKGVNYLNDCLTIINYTAKKANLHSPTINEINKLLFYLKENLQIYVSYVDDIPQSSAIFLGNDYCTYGLYAGSKTGAFRGSNAYLFWEVIKDAKKNGSDYFDFVGARLNPTPGSKIERIQRFKEHFGSEFVQGYLWEMVFSEMKFNIYQTLLKLYFLFLKKKMKKDIIEQELEKQNNEDIHSDS